MAIAETSRLIGIVALIFGVPPIVLLISNRLERFRVSPDRPVRSWLSEIGSDIRWLLISLSFVSAATIVAYPYFQPTFMIARLIVKVNFSLFFLLTSIAAVSILSEWAKFLIDGKPLTNNDRRNLLTLLPIAVSAIKLGIYFLFCLLFLASLGIDIKPFLEAGAIAAIILGLAGQNILSDIFSTLFIFTDRLFYMGDRLVVLCGEEWIEGNVVSITLRYTILDRGKGKKIAIANRTLDKFQKIENLETCEHE